MINEPLDCIDCGQDLYICRFTDCGRIFIAYELGKDKKSKNTTPHPN